MSLVLARTPRGFCGKSWERLSTERALLAAGAAPLLPSPPTSLWCLQAAPTSVSSTQTITNYALSRSQNAHLHPNLNPCLLLSGAGLTMGRELQRAVTWHRTNGDFWVL